MKKIIKFQITASLLLITTNASDLKRKYEACKASCVVDQAEGDQPENCADCTSECQNNYCRAKCYRKNNDFKKSEECQEYRDCVLEKHRSQQNISCDPEMCLDQAKSQKTCMQECNMIFDMAADIGYIGTTGYPGGYRGPKPCSQCYCFRIDNKEFLGKSLCSGPNCDTCQTRCNNAYKKYAKHGITGACSAATDRNTP